MLGAIGKFAKKAFQATGGSLLNAGLGALGSFGSAKMSQDMAREQMDFQERMSSTAYQRAADDLEAAGLNRILAIGSPASSPGGAMGAVPDMGQTLASAREADANIKTMEEQRDLMGSQGDLAQSNARAADSSIQVNDARAKDLDARARIQEVIADKIEKSDEGWDNWGQLAREVGSPDVGSAMEAAGGPQTGIVGLIIEQIGKALNKSKRVQVVPRNTPNRRGRNARNRR